jgi:hypothetical protein
MKRSTHRFLAVGKIEDPTTVPQEKPMPFMMHARCSAITVPTYEYAKWPVRLGVNTEIEILGS